MASSYSKEAAPQADSYTRDATAPAPQNSAATGAAAQGIFSKTLVCDTKPSDGSSEWKTSAVAPRRSSRAAWDKEENSGDPSQGAKGEAVPQDVSV